MPIPRERLIKEQLEYATRNIINQLMDIKQLLENSDYSSNQSFQSQIDFLSRLIVAVYIVYHCME